MGILARLLPRRFDWWLVGSTALLLALGLFVIATTGPARGHDATQQLVYDLIGLVGFFSFCRFDYRLLMRYTPGFYLAMLALLISVHLFGETILGAKRWIDFGFFQLQPSELAKLIMIIILAKYFATRVEDRPWPRHILASAIYLAIPLALVLTQPDLGTAIVFLAIWLCLLLVTRPSVLNLAATVAGLLALIPIAWSLLRPYQRNRLLVFLDPGRDPLGAGYNVTQSQIAVGSGELFGRGIGQGSQSAGGFLPVQHTDFIFASLAEELGLLGGLALFGLYLVLLLRALRVVRLARDRFGTYLAAGIVTMLFFHFVVNVGMNLGVMPVTGIPLPLISYGGTSVIVTLASLGLLQSILSRSRGLDR